MRPMIKNWSLTGKVQEWYTPNMTIDKDKKRVQITISKDMYKQLKKEAIDQDITLSDLLISACEVKTEQNHYRFLNKTVSEDK